MSGFSLRCPVCGFALPPNTAARRCECGSPFHVINDEAEPAPPTIDLDALLEQVYKLKKDRHEDRPPEPPDGYDVDYAKLRAAGIQWHYGPGTHTILFSSSGLQKAKEVGALIPRQ